MDKNFENCVLAVKRNTGIEISVFDHDGGFLYGFCPADEKVDVKFSDVKEDRENDRTLFKIKYKENEFIGRVQGTGEKQRLVVHTVRALFSAIGGDRDMGRKEFYRLLLKGELKDGEIDKFSAKFGVPKRHACAMLVTVKEGSIGDITDILENYGGDNSDFAVALDHKNCAFVRFYNDKDKDYSSACDFAEFLAKSVFEETGIKTEISLGNTAFGVHELPKSFEQAKTTARMSELFGAKGDVRSFKDYALVKILGDLSETEIAKYKEMLTDEKSAEVFEDEDMVGTAEIFFENDLNVKKTAEKMYVHRNTLNYRLEKIKRATGLDIRRFSDAVTFRLTTIICKMTRG